MRQVQNSKGVRHQGGLLLAIPSSSATRTPEFYEIPPELALENQLMPKDPFGTNWTTRDSLAQEFFVWDSFTPFWPHFRRRGIQNGIRCPKRKLRRAAHGLHPTSMRSCLSVCHCVIFKIQKSKINVQLCRAERGAGQNQFAMDRNRLVNSLTGHRVRSLVFSRRKVGLRSASQPGVGTGLAQAVLPLVQLRVAGGRHR